MYKYRLLTEPLLRLTKNFPVVVVSGARQVGKSTLLKHAFPSGSDCVVFDPLVDIENARAALIPTCFSTTTPAGRCCWMKFNMHPN